MDSSKSERITNLVQSIYLLKTGPEVVDDGVREKNEYLRIDSSSDDGGRWKEEVARAALHPARRRRALESSADQGESNGEGDGGGGGRCERESRDGRRRGHFGNSPFLRGLCGASRAA